MKKALVLVAALAIAATCAQAGLIKTVTMTSGVKTSSMKVYYDGTVTTHSVTYDKFHVTITSPGVDPNSWINAFDLKVTPVGTSGANWLLSIMAYDIPNDVNVFTPDMAADKGGMLLEASVPLDTHFKMTGYTAGTQVPLEAYYTGTLWTDGTTSEKGKKSSSLIIVQAMSDTRATEYDFLQVLCMAGQSVKIESQSGTKYFGSGVGDAYSPSGGAVTFYSPEPATLALLALGGLGLLRKRRS